MSKPEINVTPLIDVLLVLLIIFMVVSPLKPSSFKARIPQEPKKDEEPVQTHPYTLIVNVGIDSSLRLNTEADLGTVDEPNELIERLQTVFRERVENGARDDSASTPDGVPRSVFIRAPRRTGYGDVAKVIDAVKVSGAYPISLQIDDLD